MQFDSDADIYVTKKMNSDTLYVSQLALYNSIVDY